MKKFLTTFVFALLGLFSVAQENVLSERHASAALGAVYALDSDRYNSELQQISDPAIKAYVAEYNAIMLYTSANNKKNYESYIRQSDIALELAEKHRYAATLKCNLQLHRCLVEMSNGSLWGGGVLFWKAYRSFLRGEEQYPTYDGQLMLRSIFDILLSQIPEKWKGLAGFFGFGEGNLARGFSEVDLYHSKVKNVSGLNEESLILTFTNIFLSHEQRISNEQRDELRSSTSPGISYLYLLSCGRRQLGAEAEEIMDNLAQSSFERFPLILHQRAKFALRHLDADAAIRYADLFLKSYKGVSCVNDGYLIKAYALLLKGRREEALMMSTTAASFDASSDVDKRTKADALIFPQMKVELVKARFLFEYGNYAESLDVLNRYKPADDDLIEYYFRMARAEDLLGNEQSALSHYEKVIALAPKNKRYFGPYSAVYVADIKIRHSDFAAAKRYLEKARSLNDGEFSKEIDQRISLGLRSCK